MSDIKILIEVSRDEQVEIENICTRNCETISQYFKRLHTDSKNEAKSHNLVETKSVSEIESQSTKTSSRKNQKKS